MSENADNFLRTLLGVKQEVDRRLEAYLEERVLAATTLSPSAGEMTEIMKEFTLRSGKRFRAALSLFGFRCFTDREDDAVWNIAMSMELVQSYLLIHDDVIDEDATRRGGSTVHCAYEAIHRERFSRRDPKHFGISMAIMCGDLAGAMAFDVLNRARMEAPAREKILSAMTRMLLRVIHGESMDVLSESEENITEEKMRQIYDLKVSAYTLEGPLHMGGLLAGAPAGDLERMSRYATPLGEAFQIQDDILGLYGDEEKTGKPLGSDIKAGKRTFLVLKALENAPPEHRAFLEERLGSRRLEPGDLDRIRGVVRDAGALDYAVALARRLGDEAREALAGNSWRPEGVAFLEGAVNFVQNREY
jgi:geranylgeranyl diphosphate synthase type I